MPLTLSTGAALAKSDEFQARVAMAFYFVARQVHTETGVEGHEVRLNFARSIILQPWSEFTKYAAMVATDSAIVQAGPYPATTNLTLANSPADTAIIAAVERMWNSLAGVQPAK